jgi:hypothetical protein
VYYEAHEREEKSNLIDGLSQRYEFYYLYDIEILLNRSIYARRIENMLSANKRNKSKREKIIQTLHAERFFSVRR